MSEELASVVDPAPPLAAPANYETRISRESPPPAVMDSAWMPPETPWVTLNELRAEHVRLRAASSAAAMAVAVIEGRHEDEDTARHDARKAALAAGTEPELPEVTSREDRDSELGEARAHAKAAYEAFCDHVDHAVALIGEQGPEWLADLDEQERVLAEKIREQEQVLAALRSQQGQDVTLRHWVERTGEGFAANHIQYSVIAPPPPQDGPAKDAWIEEHMRSSLRPGSRVLVPVLNPRRDEDGQPDTIMVSPDSPLARTRGWHDESTAPGNDEVEVELADLDDQDLVDWLMGTGAFDGQDRPTVDVVLAVADTPELARRLLKAEDTAQGGKPRKGVVDGLTKLIGEER